MYLNFRRFFPFLNFILSCIFLLILHFTLTTFVFYFSPYFHFLDYFEILHFIFIFSPHTRPWQLCSLLGMSFLWWRLPAAPDKSSYPAQCRRNHSFANHVWPRSCTSHVFSKQDPKTTLLTLMPQIPFFLVFVWWEQGRHITWDVLKVRCASASS